MSAYDRKYYAPKSTLASTAISKSTAPPPERRIIFATEWYWFPAGAKVVRDRFLQLLKDKELVAHHEWDEPSRVFRLRCRAHDTNKIATTFKSVLSGIIKEELKKGFKSLGEDGDDEDEAGDAVPRVRFNVPDDVSEDEIEDFELGLTDSLKSQYIRRLELHQADLHGSANQSSESAATHQAEMSRPELPGSIDLFNFSAEWKEYEGDPVTLDTAISNKSIRELERLTTCSLDKNTDTGIVYIGAPTEQTLELVKSKLDNLNKVHKSRHPYARHTFYSESNTNSRFYFWPFVKVPKFFFETTLLDSLHLITNGGNARQATELPPDWQKLTNAITVRCAIWCQADKAFEPVKKVKILAISASSVTPLSPFDSFNYCARGDASAQLRILDSTLSEVPTRQSQPAIVNHLTRSPPSSIGGAQNGTPVKPELDHGPVSASQKNLRIQQWQAEVVGIVGPVLEEDLSLEQPPGKKPSWDTYKEMDVCQIRRHRIETLAPASTGLQSKLEAMKRTTSLSTGVAPSGPRSHVLVPPATAPQGEMEQSVSPPLSVQHPNPLQLSEPQKATTSSGSERATESNEMDAYSQSRNLLDDDVSMVACSILQPIEIGDFGAVLTGSMSLQTKAMEEAQEKEPEIAIEEDLISFTPPPSEAEVPTSFPPTSRSRSSTRTSDSTAEASGVEKIQDGDEVATRTFHRTMNQKAGRHRQKPTKPTQKFTAKLELPSPPRTTTRKEVKFEDPAPNFIAEMKASFSELMDAVPVRYFRGRLVLQVEFGRIILRNVMPTSQHEETPIKDEELRQAILSGQTDAKRVFFTGVLSLLPKDMQHLVEIKDKTKKNLWKPKAFKYTLTYEFHFRDLQKFGSPFFYVEVHGENFNTQLVVKRELGNTYVHGTMRHWDFRIAATGLETQQTLDPKWESVRAAIEKSLSIPPNSKTPRLLWEMDNSDVEQFLLVEVLAKRVVMYGGENGVSVLNLTEVQSLDTVYEESRDRPTSRFDSAPGPDDGPPTKRLRHWWEASISSTKANEVLRENETMELGDEPSWSAKDLTDAGVVGDFCIPACEMLKQMDGVGFENRNGISAHPVVENSTGTNKKQQLDDFTFW